MLNKIRVYLDLFVWGELGIYMYREMKKHASFLSTPTISLVLLRRLILCRASSCCAPYLLPRLDLLLEALDVTL